MIQPVRDLTINTAQATVRLQGTPGIALIEFSDFQCPFSGRYARGDYAQLQRDFVDQGLVAYTFLNLPLERIHPLALHASEAVECAGRQQKFWKMHDMVFRDQGALTELALLGYARGLDLQLTEFQACLAGGEMLPRIRAQIDAARHSSVTSNSNLLHRTNPIARHSARSICRIVGAPPYEVLAGAVRDALAGKSL